jgi:hypothetical protein
MHAMHPFLSKACAVFTEHPKATGETYGEHALFTLRTGLLLAYCGIIILVHGILPFMFTRTASRHLDKLNAAMKKRAAIGRKIHQDETIEWYL